MARTLSRRDTRAVLTDMLTIRRFEEAVFRLHADRHFTGHYHLYIGQEATGVGAIRALGTDDMVFTTHRNHGHLIARGADPRRAFAEILGRADGLLGGRGGTFHVADPSLGVPHTSALVGGCTALAVGAAHAFRSFGEKRVTAVFFGDGALEEGVTFEALNIASLWRLPVIFICENNAPGARKQGPDAKPLRGSLATESITSIPKSLSLNCRSVDGTDVKAVFSATARARENCIAGKGPVFIEAVTPGWAGNAGQWPVMATGITQIEMAWGSAALPDAHRQWYERDDPVLQFCRKSIAAGHLTADEARSIDIAVWRRIETDVEAALNAPVPAPETALDHVFA